jgi:hypothetical protein
MGGAREAPPVLRANEYYDFEDGSGDNDINDNDINVPGAPFRPAPKSTSRTSGLSAGC